MELRVYGLQVIDSQLLIEHAFIEGHRETTVNKLPMVKGLQNRCIIIIITIIIIISIFRFRVTFKSDVCSSYDMRN